MSAINPMPSVAISSSLPTKGEMKLAPALAASNAWAAEKQRVTFTMVPSAESARQVRSPASVSGTFTATLLAMPRRNLPSASMPS
jgi:hypothetical protein